MKSILRALVHRIRQAQRNQPTVHRRQYNKLLPAGHISHRRSAWLRGQWDLGDHFARGFVEGPQHVFSAAGAPTAAAGSLPDEQERLRQQRPASAGADRPYVNVFAAHLLDHVVDFLSLPVAVRDHPGVVAGIEVDRGDASVRRFEKLQPARAVGVPPISGLRERN